MSIFEEFCSRLEEPGNLFWKEEWDDALSNEIFCDYARALNSPDKTLNLTKDLEFDEEFSGFVKLNSLVVPFQKISLRQPGVLNSKMKGEFAYVKEGSLKYLQVSDDVKDHSCKNSLFLNGNYYIQRIYSKIKRKEDTLFYLANCANFDNIKYHLGFSQFNSDFFNVYISKKGKKFPLVKFEMDPSLKISRHLVNNPGIFSDFSSFYKLMKDKDCLIFDDNPKKVFLANGGSIESSSLNLKFEKALELL